MKQCNKCKEWKDESEFYNLKRSKDGLTYKCKKCYKEYQGKNKNRNRIKEYQKLGRQENKDYVQEYNKEYRRENRDILNKKDREYYLKNKDRIDELNKKRQQENKDERKKYGAKYKQENKDKIRERDKIYRNSYIKVGSSPKIIEDLKLYEEVKKSYDGYWMCKCSYCGDGFKPIREQVLSRLSSINGRSRGENRLYCSDQCKINCPIYNQSIYQKDQKPATSREVQPELRQMVFERDNYTCQKCNTHKDNLEVGIHCHHKEGILGEPLQSADMDMCITLCSDCHKEVHGIDGCGYYEMRCIG